MSSSRSAAEFTMCGGASGKEGGGLTGLDYSRAIYLACSSCSESGGDHKKGQKTDAFVGVYLDKRARV